MGTQMKKTAMSLTVGAALLASSAVQAAPVDIISLEMDMTSLSLDLNGQVHDFSTANAASIIMGTYQNPIVTMTDADGDTVTIYTQAPNPTPSGTADAALGTLSVDFTSMLADFSLINQQQDGGMGGGGGGGAVVVAVAAVQPTSRLHYGTTQLSLARTYTMA